ncbi:EAL domain-containing protein [Rhodanobacter sp. L36]|uniref:putative bifunctional diguanylate cyclase/phosphodiesterase n=1 Tax=Rhodanobacter sp. L36 TaxID=1747221 RepID=UPI00131C29CE|nr:EAL domain-containing protein [Rhodanobacter sp. L36]
MELRFRTRMTVLLLALFALVQMSTFLAFYVATRQSAVSQAQTRLESGARVFTSLMDARGAQLLDAVQLITSDFGFRQAVATGDTPTIHSVLYNQGHRIQADIVVLSDLQGHVVASLDARGQPLHVDSWTTLLQRAEHDRQWSTVSMIDGRPYQLVIVPVKAPTDIAWLGMGFALDEKLARNLKDLTRLEVTFVARKSQGASWLQSTLPAMNANEGASLLSLVSTTSVSGAPVLFRVGPADYFTLWQPLKGSDTGQLGAVLQFSREGALSAYKSLERELVLIAVLSLIASLAGGLWLSRHVTRPVSRLAVAVRRIEQGNYDTDVGVDREDELGDLADSFNRMQRGIAQREQQIAHQAHHDSLTSLPNRASLQERLDQAIENAKANGHTLAVLMLDIDRFKEINDTMGHAIGDRVLIEMGRRLRESLDIGDMLARFGGDEFVVLIEGRVGAELDRAAEALCQAATLPIRIDAMELFLDTSLGMAIYPQHGATAEELLRRADIAMYDAKQSHLRMQIYQPGRDAMHLYRLSLVNDLRRAIPNGELELYYQPKLNLLTRRVDHVEALVRWNHPQHGLIPPMEFVPLAEYSGIIRMLTDWVMHEVIRQCAAWSDQDLEIGVALNLSAMDLSCGELPEVLNGYLAKYAVDPSRLILEVTETAVMRDAVYALEVLNRLRDCGVQLAIDDFGTGYSSLSHLKRLPVNELKIDKSFVLSMAEDSDDAVIVRSTIELAHNMGLKVVAEGVEDTRTLDMLHGYHCDVAQGFLISRPLPEKEATRWLQRSQNVPFEACDWDEELSEA